MTHPHAPTVGRRPGRWLRIEAAALLVLLVAWIAWPAAGAFRVRWLGGDARMPIEPLATLPSEFPLQLELELDRPMHVYVASWDAVRGTIAMFPSSMLRSDLPPNPLRAGIHRLPGSNDGTALSWHAGDGVGPTTIMVIASERPLAELADVLLRCRQMGNAAFPKRPILGTYAPAAGMDATPPRHQIPHDLLLRCFSMLDPLHDGPMQALEGHPGVFAKALRISTPPAGPAADEAAARAQVHEGLAPLDGAFEPPATTPPAPSGR